MRSSASNQAKSFTCPAGRVLNFMEMCTGKNASGFVYQREIYECASCAGCPFHGACVTGPGNRRIHYNRKLNAYRDVAFKKLTTERGAELSKQRGNSCESPNGDLKHNQGVRRIRLRGRWGA